jgi:hypothetical protein
MCVCSTGAVRGDGDGVAVMRQGTIGRARRRCSQLISSVRSQPSTAHDRELSFGAEPCSVEAASSGHDTGNVWTAVRHACCHGETGRVLQQQQQHHAQASCGSAVSRSAPRGLLRAVTWCVLRTVFCDLRSAIGRAE